MIKTINNNKIIKILIRVWWCFKPHVNKIGVSFFGKYTSDL